MQPGFSNGLRKRALECLPSQSRFDLGPTPWKHEPTSGRQPLTGSTTRWRIVIARRESQPKVHGKPLRFDSGANQTKI